MPQQNQSGKLGKSSSPVVNRVIENSKGAQQVCNVPSCTKTGQYNKKPVKP